MKLLALLFDGLMIGVTVFCATCLFMLFQERHRLRQERRRLRALMREDD